MNSVAKLQNLGLFSRSLVRLFSAKDEPPKEVKKLVKVTRCPILLEPLALEQDASGQWTAAATSRAKGIRIIYPLLNNRLSLRSVDARVVQIE